MNEPDLFDALRVQRIDADDPAIRTSVREIITRVDALKATSGPDVARCHAEAMQAALAYLLGHPDADDMASFEQDLDGGDPGAGDQGAEE